MEPIAAWGPSCEFQQATWTVEDEEGAQVWAPAGGLPLEYASISDIFGTCYRYSLHPYVPESVGGQQQLVEYNYSTASRLNWSPEAIVVDVQNRLEVVDDHPHKSDSSNVFSNYSCATNVFNEVEKAFNDDIHLMEEKMHRYPVGLRDGIDKNYTVPRVVAIGPYHHHQPHLKPAEKVKHMAAIRCVKESGGHLLEEMYAAVDSVVDYAWRLYDEDAMVGISREDFRDMMFVDACFLVQYLRMWSDIKIDQSLAFFLRANSRDIRHDTILLENQIPWKVVETVMECMAVPKRVPLEKFISKWKGYLQHRKPEQEEVTEEDDHYLATLVDPKRFKPHLLGLLRYYTVGIGRSRDSKSKDQEPSKKQDRKPKSLSFSISAIELAEIGISLKPNKTMKLIDMSLNQEGTLLAELSLAPLSLDLNRASYLFNMAALELRTGFSYAEVEDTAVCSYLLLLALLVCREEDVQELRARGLLQGGGGLTDEEAFGFFTSFQGLPFGRCYNRVLADIEIYRESKWKEAKLYSFYYKNKKTIAAVVTGVGALVGIMGTLLSIKQSI